MNQNVSIMALIKEKKGIIVLGGLLIAALSFLFLMVNEKNFKVSTDYLIVQNQTGSQDFYTLSKSAEYIGKVLNESIYSELFVDEMVKTDKVNRNFLSFETKDRLKEWRRMVHVNRNTELGIISVEVLHNDRNQVMSISQAIEDVLTTKNNLFRGDGQNIDIRILSGPVLEPNPNTASLASVVIAGFVFGMILSLSIIYYIASTSNNTMTFGMSNSGGTILFQNTNTATKQRMESSGIFAEDDYAESLNYLDRK